MDTEHYTEGIEIGPQPTSYTSYGCGCVEATWAADGSCPERTEVRVCLACAIRRAGLLLQRAGELLAERRSPP